MHRRPCIALLLLLGAAFPASAHAGQPAVAFDGGTPAEHATVRAAFAASSFPWEIVPHRVAIHIRAGVLPHATPGEIWLDGHLLDAGRFSWAVVQHEFAHQVDFFLLDDAKRASIAARLGGNGWWAERGLAFAPDGTVAHGDLTAERFASTLTWAYWPSRANAPCARSRRTTSRRRFRPRCSGRSSFRCSESTIPVAAGKQRNPL